MISTMDNITETQRLLNIDEKGRLVKYSVKQLLNLKCEVKGHGFGSIVSGIFCGILKGF